MLAKDPHDPVALLVDPPLAPVGAEEDGKKGKVQKQPGRRNQSFDKKRVSGNLREEVPVGLIELDNPDRASAPHDRRVDLEKGPLVLFRDVLFLFRLTQLVGRLAAEGLDKRRIAREPLADLLGRIAPRSSRLRSTP